MAGDDWRAWVQSSPASLRNTRVVRDIAGVALTIAFGFVLFTLVTGHAAAAAGVLLIPAVPALAFGQVWAIVVMNARRPPRGAGWRGRTTAWRGAFNPRVFLFGGLAKRVGYVLMVLLFVGWLAGVTAFASSSGGNPTRGHAGCPYALNQHGSIECVSRATYERTQTALQRGVAGILGFFFVFHFGVASGELNRRRGAR